MKQPDLSPKPSNLHRRYAKRRAHFEKNFDKYAKGAYHQELVRDLWGQGIFAVDGDKWRQQRKLASFEFSTRVLRDFSSSVFRKNAVKLVRAVSELTRLGQAMKFQDKLMKYTMESMFKVGFGIDLNCMEGSSEEGTTFVKAFDDANELVYMRYMDPFWKLKRALNIGSEASLKKNIKVIDNFIHNVISTKKKLLPRSCESYFPLIKFVKLQPHRANCPASRQHRPFSTPYSAQMKLNVKEDILSRFLIESVKNPETMTDQYLRDIILNFLIAGKDASANTLSRFVYMLCKHRLIQEKVAQEVMDIACSQGNDASVDDFITTITDATLEKMHYLHAALTETLRLYPTVPPDGRCSLADDILPDGHKVRKGDEVTYLAYSMGRMPSIWGEDAEVFRPERWLKDGVFQPESPFKFVAFHAGPRVCLGKEFAYWQRRYSQLPLFATSASN
ncbi:hypothetical protein SCA6_015263 [Theobroma cacao]